MSDAKTNIAVRSNVAASLKSGVSIIALGIAGIGLTPTMAQSASGGAPALATTLQASAQDDGAQDEQLQSPNDQAAEDQDEAGGDDVIVVTGFRESLRGAQAIKKNSDVVVDSITAEDIGALPDRSVTEALQRVPGVTINHFAAGVDPDHFATEGSGVVVRGLSYVGSRFNGRQAFSAGNGSGLSFADVPSELLGGVDVFKTPSADMIEGGIGGIVNLRTRLPLDEDDTVLAGSLELNYGDFADKSAPTVSVLGSKRWDTGIGEIGLLGSFSYSQLFSRADRIAISAFRPRTVYSDGTRTDVIPFGDATEQGSALFPRGAVLGTQEFDRERYGYSAAAQWRSNDGTLEATAQFIRSDARQTWGEHTVEVTTDNVAAAGDSRAVAGTSLDFDDSGLFESGFLTGPTGWRADQQTADVRTPVLGLQSNNQYRVHNDRVKTDDYSAHIQWTPSDRFALSVDYQHVDSTTTVADNSYLVSTYQDAFLQLNGDDLPTILFQPPQTCVDPTCPGPVGSNPGTDGFDDDDHPSYYGPGHMSYRDPFNSFSRAALDHFEDSRGNEDAFRIDGELSFPDSGFLKAIKAGARYADTEQTARFSIYNWGVLSEQWGNGGPVWLDDNVDGVTGGNGGSPTGGFESFVFADFFRGDAGDPLQGQPRLYYAGNPVDDYDEYVAFANQIIREWQGTTTCADGRVVNNGWVAVGDRCGNVAGTIYQPGEINPQASENYAGYLLARLEHDFSNGWNLSGNIGVRYTRTHRTSGGFQQFSGNNSGIPSEAQCAAVEGTPTGFCADNISPEQRAAARAYLNGATLTNDFDLTYDYWLPNVNLKLEVGGGIQFRAGYFKGVFDPQFGYTRNNYNIQGLDAVPVVDGSGNVTGDFQIQSTLTAGNPLLRPTEADNYDFTAEYYFGNVGQLTASFFYKVLRDVVTNDTQIIDLTNNGATFPAVVTTPVNSDDVGKIKGFELAYQQTYDFLPGFLSGLGLQAAYTFVDSDGVPQTTLSSTEPDVAAGRQSAIPGDEFPLQGLSKHTVNVTPFIDIGPFSARASYNWRSRYLVTIRDVITPFDPIFQKDYGQLDASISLNVGDHFKIGAQGVNLLNSITKTEAAVLDGNGDIAYVPRQWYGADRRFTIFTRLSF
ncbi:TonB-dependent receptor [Novosphingopyxis sp.]|uniref:TonB-dependent receptor n=1 Tax=Novosphingopyxis sp. TaxID=2709690 RepID=UPI003B5A67F1